MELSAIKSAIKDLPPADRRKIALFILELEKDHVKQKYGPQIEEELENVSKTVQQALEELKNFMNRM